MDLEPKLRLQGFFDAIDDKQKVRIMGKSCWNDLDAENLFEGTKVEYYDEMHGNRKMHDYLKCRVSHIEEHQFEIVIALNLYDE